MLERGGQRVTAFQRHIDYKNCVIAALVCELMIHMIHY